MSSYHSLAVENDPKTIKGEKFDILTGILYMAPASSSGVNMCASASEGCINLCLGLHAGRASFTPSVVTSRIRKAREYMSDRQGFLARLEKDIAKLVKKAAKRGFKPSVRLNGSTDIIWERVCFADGTTLMDRFPEVTFYDYTKHNPKKRSDLPKNYTLTFSLSEQTDSELKAAMALSMGWNVAVVFSTRKGQPLPETFNINGTTWPVLDGDASDTRFLDRGAVIGLRAKGKRAQTDRSGFVRQVAAAA